MKECLNLFTPLIRPQNLQAMYDSIPKHEDINWMIVTNPETAKQVKDLNFDSRCILYAMDIEESQSNVHKKANFSFKHSKPGFWFGFDDDTTFNHNCYEAYKKYGKDYDFIVGQQILKDGHIRQAQKPKPCVTDGAQAIISTKLLEGIEFKSFANDLAADCTFLLDCWNKTDKHLILNELISNYNFLR